MCMIHSITFAKYINYIFFTSLHSKYRLFGYFNPWMVIDRRSTISMPIAYWHTLAYMHHMRTQRRAPAHVLSVARSLCTRSLHLWYLLSPYRPGSGQASFCGFTENWTPNRSINCKCIDDLKRWREIICVGYGVKRMGLGRWGMEGYIRELERGRLCCIW